MTFLLKNTTIYIKLLQKNVIYGKLINREEREKELENLRPEELVELKFEYQELAERIENILQNS